MIGRPRSLFLLAGVILGATICRTPTAAFGQTPDPTAAFAALTHGATVQNGLFPLYSAGDRTLVEIPTRLLNRDLLWHVEAARVPADFPEGTGKELSSLMIRFVRRGNRIVVHAYNAAVSKSIRIPTGLPGASTSSETKETPRSLSVEQSGVPETLVAFPILGQSPGGGLLIDISATFVTDIPDLKISSVLALGKLPRGPIDPQRSDLTYVRTFPGNIEASARITFATPAGRSASFEIHHSLTLLPETPMRPRLADSRVGYFKVDFSDYSGVDTLGIEPRAFITRYRLEKKDPDAALSEPVKPIVYYISREVPLKWRPYFKQAVEDWNVAFEAAGFKNAILAKDAPTEAEDPNWSPSDTRYSVIRWVSTPTVNAMGPHVHDPRSGEILSAHILIWANVELIIHHWYYTLCSANDPRARTLPFPDDLVGRLLRYAVAHEVGHTLGLRHNHRASTAYSIAQLRDPAFTAKNGSTASIMAYGRMNYVAQPEDKLPPESLLPRIGPYDRHVIEWGYRPIPRTTSAKDEFPQLDAWANRAIENPFLAWAGDGDDLTIHFDPRVLTQNVGSDRIEATRLGRKNLERALAYLPAASMRPGRDFAYASSFYGAILDAWLDHASSVVKEIGGVEASRTLAGHGVQYRRVPKSRQKAALAYLLSDVFETPRSLMPRELYAQIQPFTLVDSVLARQNYLLEKLLAPELASVMQDAALAGDPDRYAHFDFLNDLVAGLFSDVSAANAPIDPLRRALQRSVLLKLSENLAKPPQTADERRALLMAGLPSYVAATGDPFLTDYRASCALVLKELESRLASAATNSRGDRETRAHILECLRLTRAALASGTTGGKTL